jgi:sulfur carrier protein
VKEDDMTTPQTLMKVSLNGEALQTDAPTLQALLLARGYTLQGAFACAINNSLCAEAPVARSRLE